MFFTRLQIVFRQNSGNHHYFDKTGKITSTVAISSYTYINILSFTAKNSQDQGSRMYLQYIREVWELQLWD